MAVFTPQFLPPTRSGRTLFIAASLLGAAAAVQFLALGWYLLRAAGRSNSPETAAVANANRVVAGLPSPAPFTVAAATPAPSVLPAPTPVKAASGVAPASTAVLPAPGIADTQLPPSDESVPRPTPAARNQINPTDLLAQARELRQQGDMNSALVLLRDAQSAAPDNPTVIAEMALTFESMRQPDQAAGQWQRLYDMGKSIGPLHYLADSRLHSMTASSGDGATMSGGNGVGATAASFLPEGADADPQGFQADTVLKLTSVRLEEISDPSAEKKLSLKIAVKNKPRVVVDPRKVKIEARFYDLLDGRDVVITNAVTGFAWLTAPVNWDHDETEVLETTYLRPKIDPGLAPEMPAVSTPAPTPEARPRRGSRNGRNAPAPTPEPTPAAAPTPAPVRTYLGYSVCVYYDGQLQDQQANPIRLLQQFPPPPTLSPDQ